MAAAAFWTTLGLTILHELDAIRRHEWRVLPLTRSLTDGAGRAVFIWAHLPLGLLLIWIAAQGAVSAAGFWMSAFMVAHVGLHWLYRNHPKNELTGGYSWTLIIGAGLSGLAHILALG